MKSTPVVLKLTHPRDPSLREKALWLSSQPGLHPLLQKEGSETLEAPVFQITRKGIYLENGGARVLFHPSMALLRAIQITRGEKDRFLEAVALQPGDTLLDGTLGLATDALIAAHQVGPRGRVVGIESTAVLAALIREGLESLGASQVPRVTNSEKAAAWQVLSQAAERIHVQWGEHREVLGTLPTAAFDVVYFDPMFRSTCESSASIRPLHSLAQAESLSRETIEEACRVARKRVVLKERKGSSEFSRLGFTLLPGGKYSNVAYGIIEIKGV